MGGGSNGSPSSKNTNGGSRSISRSALGKRSHSASERADSNKRVARPLSPFGGSGSGGSIRKDKPTDPLLQSDHPNGTHHHNHHHLTSPPRSEADNNHGKGNGEAVEWPRIYIALSRKEKEDDFYAMKGTKLPHRPKKRSKAVDKTLQCCFPGMWLSDLTRARYEVRERKNVKKPKRRGLKGLENMDSDSE